MIDKAPITTHVLNLQLGKPAVGVSVSLKNLDEPGTLYTGTTDEDGRVANWSTALNLCVGTWELIFDTDTWASKNKLNIFFPSVSLRFKVSNIEEHYHVPLLLNQFGYSTYRGS